MTAGALRRGDRGQTQAPERRRTGGGGNGRHSPAEIAVAVFMTPRSSL